MLRDKGLEEAQRTIRTVEPTRPSTRIAEGRVAANRRTDRLQLMSQLRGDLDWITLKSLEKERGRRYSSASDLAADLRRYLNNEPVLASPPTTVYRIRKFTRRHRIGVAMGASFAALLVAFIVTMIVQTRGVARERDRANQQAEVANAVNDFLRRDLLAQAGASSQARPGTKPDPDLKVRTALDRAADGIEGKFKNQPEVEASIRNTIGTTYVDLGLYPSAARQLERALELRRRVLGESAQETLTTSTTLGDVYRLLGRYTEAEPLLTRTVDVRSRLLGPEDPLTLDAVDNLAIVYKYEGKYQEAERLYQKELAARRRVQGDAHVDTLTAINNLGQLYQRQGKPRLAEALLEEGVESSRKTLSDQHPVTIGLMHALGGIYLGEGNYARAEVLGAAVLDAARHVLGDKHPYTIVSMGDLAEVYASQGKYAEAEPLLQEALATGAAVQGATHDNTLLTMQKLAGLYREERKYTQAEPLARKMLQLRRRVQGEQHPDTVDATVLMASILRGEQKYAEATALLEAVLVTRRHLSALVELGQIQSDQANYNAAQSTLREAVEAFHRSGSDSWRRYNCETLLGAALAAKKQYVEAEALLTSGYEGLIRRYATIPAGGHENVKRAGISILALYKSWGKPAKAAEWQARLAAGRSE